MPTLDDPYSDLNITEQRAQFEKRQADRMEAAKIADGIPAEEPEVEEEEKAPSARELLGEYAMLKDEKEQGEFLEKHNIEAQSWDGMVDELAKRDVKSEKQQNVGQAAAVAPTGAPPSTGESYDELAAQLEKLRKQPKTTANMAKQREILKKMGSDMGRTGNDLWVGY